MAEETGATETLADSGTQPPAGTGDTQAESTGGEQASQPESISLEEAKKLRAEASSLRRRLKDLEDREKAAEDAKLTEQERIARERDDLAARLAERETAIADMRLQAAVTSAAVRLGFVDPEDALRLVDRSAVKADEEGRLTNVEDQLATIAKAKPYLLNTASKTAGSFDTGQGARATGPRFYTREQLRDPAFFTAHKADILAAQSEGRIRS